MRVLEVARGLGGSTSGRVLVAEVEAGDALTPVVRVSHVGVLTALTPAAL